MHKLVALLLLIGFHPLVAEGQLVADIIDETVEWQAKQAVRSGKTAEVLVEASSATKPYTGIAFQGFASAKEFSIQIRFEGPDGWTDWQEAHLVYSSTDAAFAGGTRAETAHTGKSELRVIGPGDLLVDFIMVGTFDHRQDRDSSPHPQTNFSHSLAKTSSTITPPPLITREEWGADPFIRGNPVALANPNYDYMTFHHAAGFSATSLEEGKQQVKAIQDLHQNVRGWSDIGYQFVIDRTGRVYQGRPFLDQSTTLQQLPILARGAHVGEQNSGNIGVCLLGCYHPPEGSHCQEVMPEVSFETYASLFAFFTETYGVQPENIRGHRDFSSTACPGNNNYQRLGELRNRVDDLLTFGNQTPDEYTLSTAFPNPFTEQTTINYFIEEDGIVSLKVYDEKGSLVSTLVEEFQSGPKLRSVDFRPRNLASGVYFVKISVEGFSGVAFESTESAVYIK